MEEVEKKAKDVWEFFNGFGLPMEQKRDCCIYCIDLLIENTGEKYNVHTSGNFDFLNEVREYLKNVDIFEL